MRKNSRRLAGYMLLLVLGMMSCNKNVVYSHYEHTPTAGWEKNDTLFLEIPPVNQSGVYEEVLGIRILNDFPFQKLTLVVDQMIYPKVQNIHEHFECSLIDEQGVIEGHGIGHIQYEFPLREITLEEGDSIRIGIRHNMKREVMPSIADIGIKVVRK